MLNFGCFSDLSFSYLRTRFCHLPVCALMKGEAQRSVGNVSSRGAETGKSCWMRRGVGAECVHTSRVAARFRLLLLMWLTCQATKLNLSYQEKQLIVLSFLCTGVII